MSLSETEQIEKLASNLARGNAKPYWILRSQGKLLAVAKPVLSPLALVGLKDWLPRMNTSFEAEFDTTGKKVL